MLQRGTTLRARRQHNSVVSALSGDFCYKREML